MQRFLTRLEAVELIEEVFNLDAHEAHVSDDRFEIVVPFSTPDEAGSDMHGYCAALGADIDPDSFEIRADRTEDQGFECVMITIRTGQRETDAA